MTQRTDSAFAWLPTDDQLATLADILSHQSAFAVLLSLAPRENYTSVAELCREFGVSAEVMAGIVKLLKDSGFVFIDDTDDRVLVATEYAKDTIHFLEQIIDQMRLDSSKKQQSSPSPKDLTLQEVVADLKVHSSTIHRLLKKGQLRGFKTNIGWLFSAYSVEQFKREQHDQKPPRPTTRHKT